MTERFLNFHSISFHFIFFALHKNKNKKNRKFKTKLTKNLNFLNSFFLQKESTKYITH